MKKTTILSMLIFASMLSVAQINPKLKEFQNNYSENLSNNAKTVFLHLNKNLVLEKESLWFAGYIYDLKTGRPDSETTNLNISIFNEDGKFLDSKVLYTWSGKASGYLQLKDQKFKPGNYIIRASTSYIDSFEDNHSYTGTFTILGSKKTPKPQPQLNYDLQLLPEGGHLLANVMNTVGVKLLNNHGKGVEFDKGYVLNNDNDTISRFNSNRFGMASFNIQPKPMDGYKVVINMKNGDQVKSPIERAETTGISLASTISSKDVRLSLLTNESTYPDIKDNTFYLGLTKNGKIKTYAFKFPEESLTANFQLKKDSLFSGVNTITVFNETFEPILERLIFNDYDTKRVSISAETTQTKGDSLGLQLSGLENQVSSLSVSILPGKTKAYNAQNNILSKFLLEPYLKGEIENGSYYFSNSISERRRNFDLDLLLLTQGWSKYSWKDSSKNNLNQPELVQGFNIDGKVFENIKNKNQVFIRNEKSGVMEILELEEDKSFALENVFIEDSTEIAIGIIRDRKGKIQKPSISLNITPAKNKSNLDKKIAFFKDNQVQTKEIPQDFISDAEVLDTVNINGIKKSDRKKDFLIAPTTGASSDYIEIDENIARSNLYITDLIQKKFFMVRRTPAGVEITARMPSRIINDGPFPTPQIFLNGARLRDDLNILATLLTSEVKSIYINRAPTAGFGGFNQGGGVIRIKTKTGAERFGSKDNSVAKVTVKNGYQPYKKFYAPKYDSYNNWIFEEYGVIGWFPEINTGQGEPVNLSVLNTLQDELKIYIQGITPDGKLISEELSLNR
ncbi:hypothetical protein [Christiangramia sp. SM2212]|uniref:TonB-dependent receptor plug domain-containing protein n=1 Tax=Christiangramia sediminicola TaxID=3073267 RepID=A0ABU1EM57_9FLAO|nr:hypothetical protein [Christiangramia sp. SM2212]MDR5589462.1 hypothetical protein [Christiangramia sp. SM2212]